MPSDFSGQNLRGRSFRDQDLTGADFSYADIRGADFKGAVLRGANLSYAKAGLSLQGKLLVLTIVCLLSISAGIFSGFAGTFLEFFAFKVSQPINICLYIATSIELLILCLITVQQGARSGLRAIAIIIPSAGTIAGLLTFLVPEAVVVPFVAGSLVVPFTAAITAEAIAYTVSSIISTSFILGPIISTIVGTIAGSSVLIKIATTTATFPGASDRAFTVSSLTTSITFTAFIILLSIYISWRILIGDGKYTLISEIAITLAANGGTSFYRATLTDANFFQAKLKNIDLRNAQLTRTNFHKTYYLRLSRISHTTLQNPIVCNLAVTHRGASQSYVGLNLKGIYLAGADLSDADLTEADLSNATLEGAWLERANLTKAQALNTNFNRARLTAACLEAWNIDSSTQLEGAICQYVYLRNGQQERRPSSGEFAPGEFTKLFQEVINTVDLIFRNGIDWKAFHYSFHQLQVENEDIVLSIRSIENKGDGVVVVRVDAPIEANKAQLHADFTQTYNLALQALEEKYRAELKSKDEQIAIYRQHQADLHQLAQLLASRPVSLSSEMLVASATQAMGKRVILKLGQGNLASGFPVTLQIGSEASLPSLELSGQLAACPELTHDYRDWQAAYYESLQANFRLDIPDTQITNVSRREFFQDCHEAAEQLRKQLNLWLNSEIFRPIKEQLLEQLDRTEPIQFILQTEDPQLRLLPLQLWNFFERYSKAELALATSAFERVNHRLPPSHKVKILAILGDSTGINVQKDSTLLAQLPEAEVTFLVEPQRQEVSDHLWAQPWGILFFAGHSSSEKPANLSRSSSQKASASMQSGYIHLNKTDCLTIPQLKHALRKAIEQGLQLAIFNSCDGLGLASDLADLHIPQMIVMREPVPDKVAQEFLKNFLSSFSAGTALYQAVREAREKLQGLEDQFPCATWLPVICQNPAVTPLTWRNLRLCVK